jgi:hypothetical protein
MSMTKDPNAVLDFGWDWADSAKGPWLTEGDTIATATVTVPDGITLDSTDNDDTTVTAWLSGGTVGASYTVTCHVTTSQGRADDRSIRITIRER